METYDAWKCAKDQKVDGTTTLLEPAGLRKYPPLGRRWVFEFLRLKLSSCGSSTQKGCWFYSRYPIKCLTHPKTSSNKHPDKCLTSYLGTLWFRETHNGYSVSICDPRYFIIEIAMLSTDIKNIMKPRTEVSMKVIGPMIFICHWLLQRADKKCTSYQKLNSLGRVFVWHNLGLSHLHEKLILLFCNPCDLTVSLKSEQQKKA